MEDTEQDDKNSKTREDNDGELGGLLGRGDGKNLSRKDKGEMERGPYNYRWAGAGGEDAGGEG